MKATVIYFSPTGTSARVAGGIIRGLDGMEIEEIDVTKAPAGELKVERDGFLLVVSPVYGGHVPAIVRGRLDSISGDSTPAAIVAVYGNRAFEKAVTDMSVFLSERGFIPVAGAAFVGEHSYSSASNPIAVGRPDDRDLADAAEFGRILSRRLSSAGSVGADLSSLTDDASSPESLANFINFVREYQTRQSENPTVYLPIPDADVCKECGTCIDVCPTAAIDAESFMTDSARCIKCCACVKSCPAGARRFNSPFAPVLSANFSARKAPRWIL